MLYTISETIDMRDVSAVLHDAVVNIDSILFLSYKALFTMKLWKLEKDPENGELVFGLEPVFQW